MKITLDNYEQYVLDFLEGNLPHNVEVNFENFLDSHPVIMDEIKGVDQLVLIPDDKVVYPDKSSLYRREGAIVIPFWNISRIVAAAVGLVVVTTATFFIWKSSMAPESLRSYDNQLTTINPEINKLNLPTTRTPMPEGQQRTEEPSTDSDMKPADLNVMVQQENRSRELDGARKSSPTLTSAPLKKNHRSEQTVLKPFGEPVGNDAILIRQMVEVEKESIPLDLELSPPPPKKYKGATTVGLLPLRTIEIDINKTLDVPIMASLEPDRESQTYKIHIPGQFLSETWTDVSMTNFKKKLIPVFIKNQLNL